MGGGERRGKEGRKKGGGGGGGGRRKDKEREEGREWFHMSESTCYIKHILTKIKAKHNIIG